MKSKNSKVDKSLRFFVKQMTKTRITCKKEKKNAKRKLEINLLCLVSIGYLIRKYIHRNVSLPPALTFFLTAFQCSK